ncbi:MAG: YqgE/AlgH family protein [Imperialibacter sp.]|uniref:YqgE/AlgH family protein n=1 Tax=Imperialibacter sp. TaxID=2038411 RepID=UPI0032F004CB
MEHFDAFKRVNPNKGDLLISEPYLSDPNFERSVILLCEHDVSGSIGFVLNRLSELSLAEVIEGAPDDEIPLFIGGPVQQDTLHFVHCSPHLMEEGREIARGIYWGGDFEKLMELMSAGLVTADEARFFIGYSGWGAGQLSEELDTNSWIVNKKTAPQYIFEYSHEELWRQVLKDMGGKFRAFSNFPADPRLN